MVQVTAIVCPTCGTKGKTVSVTTVRALLSEDAVERIEVSDGFRFCRTSTCSTSYYQPGGPVFDKTDVRVPIFQKDTDPSRLVCYCFEHRIDEIEREIARTRSSRVPDDIAAKCKQGLEACETLNPEGSCCLGNVRWVVKNAPIVAHRDVSATSDVAGEMDDCCASRTTANDDIPTTARNEEPAARTGMFAIGGAVVAAILSSACCWLPLVLIGAGASAVGVAGFFESYRTFFLLSTVGLLGVGFYFVYVRKPDCAPGSACEIPSPRLEKMNKLLLWIATAFVGVFALFPTYVDALITGGEPPIANASGVAESVTLIVDGMTCAGCETNVKVALEAVEGVQRAEVSFTEKVATVYFVATAVDTSRLVTALQSAGYRGAQANEDATEAKRSAQ